MAHSEFHGCLIPRVRGKMRLAALDVAIRTEDFYRSLLRRHVLPRWGEHGLADISGIKAAAWAKQLRDKGYAPVTVGQCDQAAPWSNAR